MGGSAFATGRSNPLYTPRMPKHVYTAVKDRCHAILREHYLCVASPIDGPGKKDFGDVDILLAWPLNPSAGKQEAFDAIADALKATETIVDKGKDVSGHLALPWPSDVSLENQTDAVSHPRHLLSNSKLTRFLQVTQADQQQEDQDQDQDQERFIQVDVRVCDTLEYFQWMLFKHAHGDVWNLLGTTIRPYGLSVDECSLWLRIPEIEAFNRRRAKVFLSSDPAEILQFLGLPIEEFWSEPFDDLDGMYEYVARCRLFWVSPLDSEKNSAGTELEQDRKKLKANDRKRMNQRPGFRKWVEDFKPRCRQEGRFLVNPTTREQITQEAFDWFHVEDEFKARRQEFLLERQREMIWTQVIKGSIPEADPADERAILYRSCLVKALKRVILEDDGRYGVLPERSLKDQDGFYISEDVVDFITRHQDAIGRAAMEISHAGYVEQKKKKAAKAAEKEKSL